MDIKKVQVTPRDFFMNLLVFGALYASVVSFLALIFAYINVFFPDNLEYGYYGNYTSSIIAPSSILMVIFPVFILISWLLGKDFTQNPEKREMKFRKWLIYLTLFAAAVTIIVDLITLVSGFYNGELTNRFIFKILAILLVAAGVFWYYFLDLKQSSALKPKLSAWVASLVIVAALAGGFFIIGSPAQQRARRFDQRRIGDLQLIQSQLLNYWIQKEKLPENLDELSKDQLSGFVLPQDPETSQNYSYNKLTAFSFKLCGNFKTDHPGAEVAPTFGNQSPQGILELRLNDKQFRGRDAWAYRKRETCFERTIDPELYKKPNV